MPFKPMLAGNIADVQDLTYPVLCSPKLDGIRCMVLDGVPLSRNMKPIRNKIVYDMLMGMPSFDGELIVGSPRGEGVYNRTNSGVMSFYGIPDFTYYVFDVVLRAQLPFNQRLEMAKQWASASGRHIQHVPHKLIRTPEGLLEHEAQLLLAGFEGVMVRSLDGPYKHGRSTLNEGWLLKLKRSQDSEAEILGFEEKLHNDNELTRDELGRAKRSSHKSGKRQSGTLGALKVRDIYSGVEFSIGTGLDDATRQSIWSSQPEYLSRIVKYKFLPIGVKDKPRHPVFLGFRDAGDL